MHSPPATERLLLLEEREAEVRKGGGLLKTGLALGALGVNTVIHEDKRLSGSNSSAPARVWQNYLPYEFYFDIKNGGVAASWEPRLRLADQAYLALKVTPIGFNEYGDDWIWFSQGDLYLMYNHQNNIISYGLGPTVNSTWARWPGHKQVNYGGGLFFGLLNKIRLTMGVRSFEKGAFSGGNFYLHLGITDIPGISYWLTR